MSELPSTWTQTTLSDLASQGQYGWTTKATDKGSIKYLRTTDITKGEINWQTVPYCLENPPEVNKYRVQVGDILISRAGSVGYSALIEDMPVNAVFASYLIRFVLHDEINAKYLAYFLKSNDYWQQISEASAGIALANVNAKKLANVVIPLAPLAEQKRIADKLDVLLARVNGCRARLARVPAILKRFRQAVLAAATSGALTAEWRGEDTTLGWDWERAEDVCEKVQSGGTPKEGFVESEGIPFLKVYNIVDQKVNFFYKPQFVTVNVHNAPLAKSRAKPGDVLMNIVGPPLGKVAIVPDDFPEWNINQAITLFRPGSRVITEWLYYFLCSGISVASVEHQTRGSAGQSNISLSQCRNFIFPVPPLKEQHEIIHRVEILFGYADRLEARYMAAATRVERLTPALLAKAFRGELVAQDPQDEPAALLLARLQGARQQQSEQAPSQQSSGLMARLRRAQTEFKQSKPEVQRSSTSAMKPTAKHTPTQPISIVQALRDANEELSSDALFVAAGYPPDADAELVEEFLVALRTAIRSQEVTKVRRDNQDWFSVAK